MSQSKTDYRSVVSSSGSDVLRIVARPPQPIRLYPRPKASCFADDGQPAERFPDAPRSERLEPEVAALEERHFLGLSPYRQVTLHAPGASEGSTVAVRVHSDTASWASVQTQGPGQVQPLPPDPLPLEDGQSASDGSDAGSSRAGDAGEGHSPPDAQSEDTSEIIEVEVDSGGIGDFTLRIDRAAFLRHVENVDPSDEEAWREHAKVRIQAATSADAFSADAASSSGRSASGDSGSGGTGSAPAATGDLHLLVQCNAATSLDAILNRQSLLVGEEALFPSGESDDAPTASASSVVGLVQEALNQIVTRHGAADVAFIPENGEYLATTCASVRELLAHFGRDDEEAFEYAEANFGIQLDDAVADYVRRTYRVDSPETSGVVMDRRLLFGTGDAWSQDDPVEDLDGLISLRTNLIGRFFEEVDAQAAPYLDADTFWLHRPEHSPYQEGAPLELTVTERTRLRTLPGATGHDGADDADADETAGGPPADVHSAEQDATHVDLSHSQRRVAEASTWVQDDLGTPVWLSEGDTLTVRQPNEAPFSDTDLHEHDWYFVETGDGQTGWISAADDGPAEVTVRDDRVHGQNHGTYGGPGMAYTLGSKDRPDKYRDLLESNDPGPDDIQCWSQYEEGHQTGAGYDTSLEWQTGYEWAGIDCSGFVQNVLMDARLWDGETPIATRSALPRRYRQARYFDKAVAGNPNSPYEICTRTIPFDKTSRDKAYVNKGDVIANQDHVVIVGEEDPEVTNGTREQFDYTIYQARGMTVTRTKNYIGEALNSESEVPSDQFVRKVVASPMEWWASGILGFWFDQAEIDEAEEDEREPKPKEPTATPGRVFFWK